MQYQNQVLQSHQAEALFVELGEDELNAVVGGCDGSDSSDTWRKVKNVFRKAGNAVSDFGKGGKDGVRGDNSRRDTLAYNLAYATGDILDRSTQD